MRGMKIRLFVTLLALVAVGSFGCSRSSRRSSGSSVSGVGSLTVTSVSPAQGTQAGGTLVTVTGAGFTNATDITFGGTSGSGLTVTNDTTIKVSTPTGLNKGKVDVVVVKGSSSVTKTQGYEYIDPAPTITAITPPQAPSGSGVAVIITGTGFFAVGAGVPTITVGGIAATGVVVNSPTSISCTFPDDVPGKKDVVITNLDGQTVTLVMGFERIPGTAWSRLGSGLPGPDTAGTFIFQVAVAKSAPATVFAAVPGGLFKSTDSGASWTAINTGITSKIVLCVAVDPANANTIYCGTSTGLFKSTNGGTSFTNISGAITTPSIAAIVIDPTNASIINVATNSNGFYRSTDAGVTFVGKNTGLIDVAAESCYDLVAHPSVSGTLYLSSFNTVYQTVDGGTTWTDISGSTSPLPVASLIPTCVTVDSLAPTTIYVGFENGTVFKTTAPSGTTTVWTSVSTGLTPSYASDILVDPSTTGATAKVYLARDDGTYMSPDGGTTWNKLTNGFTLRPDCYGLAIDPVTPAKVYAATTSGVYRSTNSGTSWVLSTLGMEICRVRGIAVDKGAPATVYVTTSTGVFKTTNGGATWTSVNSGIANTTDMSLGPIVSHPVSTQTLYVGSFGSGGVYKSTNGGGLWTQVNTGLPAGVACFRLGIDPVDPNTVYAVVDTSALSTATLYKTTNGGTSWTQLTGAPVAIRKIVVTTTSIFVASGSSTTNAFSVSTNGGTTFTATGGTGLLTGASNALTSFVVDPTAGTFYASDAAGGVFKTATAANWTASNAGIAPPLSLALSDIIQDPTNAQVLYVGTSGTGTSGVAKTKNATTLWASASTGLDPDVAVATLGIDPLNTKIVFAGTSLGLYKTTSGGE